MLTPPRAVLPPAQCHLKPKVSFALQTFLTPTFLCMPTFSIWYQPPCATHHAAPPTCESSSSSRKSRRSCSAQASASSLAACCCSAALSASRLWVWAACEVVAGVARCALVEVLHNN